MRIGLRHYRTIFVDVDGWTVHVIDQTLLPFTLQLRTLRSLEEAAAAIRDMVVRGAPLIGVTAAYGIALAMRTNPSDSALEDARTTLLQTRPTAVNLRWALHRMRSVLEAIEPGKRTARAYAEASAIAEEDVAQCRAIGRHGRTIIDQIAAKAPGRTINVLTHCNAGWLACVDWGTALAPVYDAFDAGVSIHVYVDETRPRNQGAALTAYELGAHGVPHTIVADNAGGHLMQHGQVDLCIVGSDRTTATGDVANKIGTYLKALAAQDNDVPFYVALPSSTIDWSIDDGLKSIPIEERSATEVTHMSGQTQDGRLITVRVAAPDSPAANPGFDVTPSRLVTGIITERGVCAATWAGLRALFPESQHSTTP